MKIIPNISFSSRNLTDFSDQPHLKTAKRYLDHIISIIASYAPLITFWTTLLYVVPQIEAHAIIVSSPTTTTTPEPDQVDIRPVPLPTKGLCFPQPPVRATDVRLCYDNTKDETLCTIL